MALVKVYLKFSLPQKQQLDEALLEVGLEGGGEGKFDFATFCAVAAKFMIEEDEEQVQIRQKRHLVNLIPLFFRCEKS